MDVQCFANIMISNIPVHVHDCREDFSPLTFNFLNLWLGCHSSQLDSIYLNRLHICISKFCYSC